MPFHRMRQSRLRERPDASPLFKRGEDPEGNPYVVRTSDMGCVYMEFISMAVQAMIPLMPELSKGEGEFDLMTASKAAIDSFMPAFTYAMAYEHDVIADIDGGDVSDGADAIFFTREGDSL